MDTIQFKLRRIKAGQILIAKYSERNPGDPYTVEGRTYFLDCNGRVVDTLYLTDRDILSYSGHNIAEIEVYGSELAGKYVNTFAFVIHTLCLAQCAIRYNTCVLLSTA